MNLLYLSLEDVIKTTNEIIERYNKMLLNGKTEEEKNYGRIGVIVSSIVKKNLIKKLKLKAKSN